MSRKSPIRMLIAAVAIAAVGGVIGAGTVYATQTFSDVGPAHPFYDEIEWGARNDITSGYGDGTFRPQNTVTRQAAMAWFSNFNDTFYMSQTQSGFSSTNVMTQSAQCDSGDRALAGGGRISAGSVMITDSYPIDGGGSVAYDPFDATGWKVRWESDDDATYTGTTYAWVLCGPQLANY